MVEQLDKSNYVKLAPVFTQPLKLKRAFYNIYIQKALWNIAINLEKIPEPEAKQNEQLMLRVMYLLENFLLAQDYLVENRFPMVVPVLKPQSQHKVVDVVYDIEHDNERSHLYLGCSDFCILETKGRLSYTLREL